MPWVLDYLLVTHLRWIDRRLRPYRYWTQQELDAARAEAERMRRDLGWYG